MTKRQQFFYLDLAGKAYRAAVDPDDHAAPSFDAWRHAQVAAVLGAPKRFRAFSNLDLDRVLNRFRLLAGLDLPEDGSRRRTLYRINQLLDELGDDYVRPILWDRFKIVFREELATLDDARLRQLLTTLHARAQARATHQEAHP